MVLRTTLLALVLSTLSILNMLWAAPVSRAAHYHASNQARFIRPSSNDVALRPVKFREDRNAGLLVNVWINEAGPFTCAIDTGAGASIITKRVVSAAGLQLRKAARQLVGGLSTARIAANQQTQPTRLAIGTSDNEVPGSPTMAVVTSLPGSLDGILDPTDLFGTLAYSIDLPNRQLLAFDPKLNDLDLSHPPKDGAIVRWLRQGNERRPFVRLGDGRSALIDTGSGLGFALPGSMVNSGSNHSRPGVGDLGGGAVQSRELTPAIVSIGALELRSVPTEMLIGVPADTPIILGRRALYPFKITFEPVSHLIIFEPTRKRE